jgi:hypothetical protein
LTLEDRKVRAALESEAMSLAKGPAAVVWTHRGGYWGYGHNIYVFLKKQALFPYSKGDSREKALDAGWKFRRLCRDVWKQIGKNPTTPYRLSTSHRKQEAFVKQSDNAIVDAVGSEPLSEILGPMGVDIRQWRGLRPVSHQPSGLQG